MQFKIYFLTAATLNELANAITELNPENQELVSQNAGYDSTGKVFYVMVRTYK